jgi:hypothetical protein
MRMAIVALLCTAFGASAADPRVVRWTHAEASKRFYKGSCPIRLLFTGTISAARPGEFTYAWKRSDGMVGPLRTVEAKRAGESWRVREVWEVSGTTRGWAQIWIASEQRGSPAARFRVQCK